MIHFNEVKLVDKNRVDEIVFVVFQFLITISSF